MPDSRLKKVLGDLRTNRARSLLVLLSIFMGVTGAGVVLDSGAVLSREMSRNYLETNPASAVFTIAGAEEAALAVARAFPGIEDAELAHEYKARVRAGAGEWKTLYLYVLPDYGASRIDLARPDSGAWPPGPGQILIERAAVAMLGGKEGSTAAVSLGSGDGIGLAFAGTVHAPGLAPAWMERCVYGWTDQTTAESLGGEPEYRYLKITVKEGKSDKAAIMSASFALGAALSAAGVEVTHVEIPKPGQHPHATRFGMIFFEAPLRFAVSVPGFFIWLGLAVLASLLASLAPAASANAIPVRKAIAWE